MQEREVSKRGRDQPKADTAKGSNKTACSTSESSIIEEIVEEEEVSHVLMRFPCFDFFKNVHLCEETRKRPRAEGDAATTAEAEGEDAFCPDQLAHFVPGTLLSSHPQLIINKGQEGKEMLFRGVWDPKHVLSGPMALTNRAILSFTTAAGGQPSASASAPHGRDTGGGDRGDGVGAAPSPGIAVQSLFPHAEEGLSADESREKRERMIRDMGLHYTELTVPKAVLVMHRYK